MKKPPIWFANYSAIFLSSISIRDENIGISNDRVVITATPRQMSLSIANMKLSINLLFALLISVSCLQVLAQDQNGRDQITRMIPNPIPLSPNAAALGKFGDYKVSYFSGLPDISIPIYEIKSGELSVPITLSYHASGIKMNDIAGWCGMGWAVSTGGQITRKVNGGNDETGYYASTSSELTPSATVCNNWNYLWTIGMGGADMEPDVFTYNFPGKSGRFMLGSQGLTPPYLIPAEPLIVKAPPSTTTTVFNKFEIIDERGVLHRFGTNSNGNSAIESTGTVSNGVPNSSKTSWLLMEMIDPNIAADNISFNYNSFVGTTSRYDPNSRVSISDMCFNTTFDSNTGTRWAECPTSVANVMNSSSYSSNDQQFISTITFKTGKVEFLLGTRSDETTLRSLDKINIYSLVKGQYVLMKSVQFQYSYFSTPSKSNAVLKLDAIKFLDKNGASVQQYTFGYATNSFSWDNIFARDYWGFYNGRPNEDLIPKILYDLPSTQTIGTADRTANTQYLTEGVLNKITYPTGGFTQFEYEPHKYADGPDVFTGGGIRIAKITSDPNDGSRPVVKTFKYGINESGIGDPNFSDDQYGFYTVYNTVLMECLQTGSRSGELRYRTRTWYSRSSFETDGFESAPVNYLQVTEYLTDLFGNKLGKTVYEYDNGIVSSSGVPIPVPFSTKLWYDSFSWSHGMLTRKTVYDQNDNRLKKNEISYGTYRTESRHVGYGVYISGSYLGCPSNYCVNESNEHVDPLTMNLAFLTQNTGVKREISNKEYTYQTGNENQFVLKQTDNTYESAKLQVTQSVITASDVNEQKVVVSRYPFQLTTSLSSTGNALGMYMLNAKHIISKPFETYTYLQKEDGTNQRIVEANLTTYRRNENNSSQVVPDNIYFWESAISKAGYSPSAINSTKTGLTTDPNLVPRINLLNYDDEGNLLDAGKTNDAPVAYLYGYNKELPIAEATNSLAKNIFHTSFEEDITGISAGGKTGVQYATSGFTKSLTLLNPGNYILSYYTIQGNTWVSQQSVVTVPASGSYVITLTGAVDEVRFYPVAARMTTYTYEPFYGITSSTDPNNKTTYYKYDSFGRLEVIKDDDLNVLKRYKYNYYKP
jgi:YD repeat-containing protein